jgi:hypothetical protein
LESLQLDETGRWILQGLLRAPPSSDDAAFESTHHHGKIDSRFNTSEAALVQNIATVMVSRGADKKPSAVKAKSHQKIRFRALKSGQWFQKLQELVEYQRGHGHCHVPHNWSGNVALAQWVKRQRYQYKLREEGKHSTLTDERKDSLDHLGFVWSSHRATWEERLVELKAYAQIYGNCSVPMDFSENRTLAIWVKCQRRHYKLFLSRDPAQQGTVTPDRIQKLDALEFVWDPRKLDSKLTHPGDSDEICSG